MSRIIPIEERVRRAHMSHGSHLLGHRYSIAVWPMFRRPPKAVGALVERLRRVVESACSPDDITLLKAWGCKPVFYDPVYLPKRAPGAAEKLAARKLCHERALAAFGKPGRVVTDWEFGDGSHTGWSVVVSELEDQKWMSNSS